jgi:hypothetical protein
MRRTPDAAEPAARKSLFRRAAVIVGLAGLAATGSLAAAAPASAGPSCPAGYHCVFFSDFASPRHRYFNSDPDFSNDVYDGTSLNVNNTVFSASNSSTGGYESHYYYGANYTFGLVFCVNPGSSAAYTQLSDDGAVNNFVGQRNEASSLRLRPTTPIRCF